MIEDRVRDDIAFIRRAVEEGRNYATHSSPEIMIWGIAVAVGLTDRMPCALAGGR